MPSLLTLWFLGQLLGWAITGPTLLDRAASLRGPKDSGIPSQAMVGAVPAMASARDSGAPWRAGVRVGVYLPQQTHEKKTGQLAPFFTFEANQWPLTFALHNARLRAEGGKAAQIDDWVSYVAVGRFSAKDEGRHSFVFNLRTPAEYTSCFVYLILGGVEVFPAMDRKTLRNVPPRIVMEAGQRRVFQRDITLKVGSYDLELIAACHPSGKGVPEIRVTSTSMAAWQATEVNLQIKGPKDTVARPFSADELGYSARL